jgi:hypothetical protein
MGAKVMETGKQRKYKANEKLLQRNDDIRKEFQQMKREGIKNREALLLLADKYFLSEHTVNSIVYSDN